MQQRFIWSKTGGDPKNPTYASLGLDVCGLRFDIIVTPRSPKGDITPPAFWINPRVNGYPWDVASLQMSFVTLDSAIFAAEAVLTKILSTFPGEKTEAA